jgi:hypothetical protein
MCGVDEVADGMDSGWNGKRAVGKNSDFQTWTAENKFGEKRV